MAFSTCRFRRGFGPILLVWGGLASSVCAQTVINIPPDPVPEGIRSSTELNLLEGGQIDLPFYIGRPIDVNEDIRMNIRGGRLGDGIAAYGGATIELDSGSIGRDFRLWPTNRLDVWGGRVGTGLDIRGGEVSISGGLIGDGVTLSDAARFDVFGGEVGSLYGRGGSVLSMNGGLMHAVQLDSGEFTIRGGMVSQLEAQSDTEVALLGGQVTDAFRLNDLSTLRIAGSDFRLNGEGVDFADAGSIPLEVPREFEFSGTLSDGSPFRMSSRLGDVLPLSVGLELAELPPIDSQTFSVPSDPPPTILKRGQTLNVELGGEIRSRFGADRGSTINIGTGGTVGENLFALGATVNVNGGLVGAGFQASDGSDVRVQGGLIDWNFHVREGSGLTVQGDAVLQNVEAEDAFVSIDGGEIRRQLSAVQSEVDIDGGSIGIIGASDSRIAIAGGRIGTLGLSSGSRAEVAGGIVHKLQATTGSSVHISDGVVQSSSATSDANVQVTGGRLLAIERARLVENGTHRVLGGDFAIDGLAVEGLDDVGSTKRIEIRDDAVLTGTLSDGTPFWENAFGDDDDGFDVELVATELPTIETGILVASELSKLPYGIRTGQTLLVDANSEVPDYFIAGQGSRLEIEAGGVVGDYLDIVGATATIAGEVGDHVRAHASTVNVLGGALRGDIDVSNSDLLLKDATIEGALRVMDGSRVTVDGGELTAKFVFVSGSQLTLNRGRIAPSGAEGNLLFVQDRGTLSVRDGSIPFGISAIEESSIDVSAGLIGGRSELSLGSSMTVRGGRIDMLSSRGELAVSGGSVGDSSRVRAGGTLRMSGGTLGENFAVERDAHAEIVGGKVGHLFRLESGGNLVVSGGTFGDFFRSRRGANLTIRGFDFQWKGAIDGLDQPGDQQTLTIDDYSFLTGVLADGTPFAFSRHDGDAMPDTVTLEYLDTAPPLPDRIVASEGDLPLGLRSGLLIVDDGGLVPNDFSLGSTAMARIETGGTVGDNFEVVGGRVLIEGGSVGDRMDLIHGAELSVSGGRIGRAINLFAESKMTLHGDAFYLDGEPFDELSVNGDRWVVDDRQGRTLTGRLVDGHHFSFTLNSNFGDDFFHEEATVELVLAPGDALACDFDANRECDLDDLNPLLNAIATNDLRFDIDGSGEVDDGDIQTWLAHAGDLRIGRSYAMGDATLDGLVDQKDLNVIGLHWQANVRGWDKGDFNGDGLVDSRDLDRVGQNWQSPANSQNLASPFRLTPDGAFAIGTNSDRSTVPEPSRHSLISLILTGLLWRQRQRRRAFPLNAVGVGRQKL